MGNSMKFLKELLDETPDHINIMEAIELACEELMVLEGRRNNFQGGRSHPKYGHRDFFNNNPKLVTGAAALAISGNKQYQINKRGTFTLHAKDAYERRMITRIVDALTTSKHFRIARTKFAGGGKTWVLKKV